MGQKIIAALVFCVYFYSPVYASGTTAAFSSHVSDGRITAMGSAGTSIANDANACFWNPAALGALERNDIVAMTSTAVETQYTTVFMAFKNFGVGISHASLGGVSDTSTLDSYTFRGDVMYAAMGFEILPSLHVGATGKYLQQTVGTAESKGGGMDVGIVYSVMPWLTVGASGQNIIKTPYESESGYEETLHTAYRYGTAFSFFDKQVLLATEIEIPDNRSNVFHVGIQYAPLPFAAFRIGLNDAIPTIGFGLSLSGVRFDMSWENASQHRGLEDQYSFSIGLSL